MTSSTNQYEYYAELHEDFSEAYQDINKYVIDLYTLPKNFIEETSPALDRFLREYAVPGAPGPKVVSSRSVLNFISQVDDFTTLTVELFHDHKAHVNECAEYMERVFTLRRLQQDSHEISQADYVALTPTLLGLHSGLKSIKDRADRMVERLERLERKWFRMKSVINT